MSDNLSNRLKAAASLVRGGGILADIGTDHGYVPVYLVKNGIVKSAIAADINKMPLENAAKAVRESGLCDKIQLRLSDGLKNLKEGEADEFFIAGMGGTLISEILSSSIWVKNSAYHFVFQPQSRAEELREYLFNNGFEIERETAVLEGRRYCIAFSAVFTGKNTPHCYADCFLGKLPKTPEAKKYISLQINRLGKKYNALSSGEEKERLFITLEKLKSFSSED